MLPVPVCICLLQAKTQAKNCKNPLESYEAKPSSFSFSSARFYAECYLA